MESVFAVSFVMVSDPQYPRRVSLTLEVLQQLPAMHSSQVRPGQAQSAAPSGRVSLGRLATAMAERRSDPSKYIHLVAAHLGMYPAPSAVIRIVRFRTVSYIGQFGRVADIRSYRWGGS